MGRWLALLAVLLAMPAVAATRYVDGGCAVTGNGSTLTCGSAGPFRTIGEGVLAMQPGDTLHVRAGVYFESLTLANGTGVPGKALPCTAAARCTIQGYQGEVPVIRGMTLRSWTDAGGGVYRRTMEASPNTDPLPPDERDAYDPGMLLQGTDYPLTNLAYAGDSVAAPPEGQWSYFPATHEVRVNPLGTADPNATVYVPHFGMGAYIASPTANVTLANLDFEGPRQKILELQGPGIHIESVRGSYWTEHGIHCTGAGGCPGLTIEDSLIEYGGRGRSWAPSNSDAAMGIRGFKMNGGAIRRTTVRHVGANGRYRYSCGPTCVNGWRCATCDPPWNGRTYTYLSISGVAVQIKQTSGFTFEDNVAEDIGAEALVYDVARHVVGRRNVFRRVGLGFDQRNYTPTSGYTYACDDDFLGNTVEDSGADFFDQGTPNPRASIQIPSLTQRETDCTYVAHVNDNTVIAPRTQPFAGAANPPLVVATGNVVTNGGTTSTSMPPSTTSTTRITSTTLRATTSTSTSSTTTSTVMCPSITPCP